MSCMILHSCSSVVEVIYGDGYASSARRTLKRTAALMDTTGKKSLILVPMVHVGREKDYKRIRQYLDNLKLNGYVTFYEEVPYSTFSFLSSSPVPIKEYINLRDSLKAQDDSVRLDALSRKMRRCIGKDPSVALESYAKRGKIKQSIEVLGLTTNRDYWTDMSAEDMVQQYEELHGKIELSSYDWAVPLDDPKYNSRKAGGRIYRFVNTIRDEHLLSLILSSDFDKIAVVYGAAHTNQVKFHLIYDHHFKKVKRK